MTYWQNLSDRDRWALSLGLGVVVFYLFYLLVYAPLAKQLENKQKWLTEQTETLQWMQNIAPKPITAKKKINDSRLLSLLSTELNAPQFRGFPYQLQQGSSGEIQLGFEKIPYQMILIWLWKLSSQYEIEFKQINIEKTSASGIVKLNVSLTAQASIH